MTKGYVCPFCKREFPRWYWGILTHAGNLGTKKIRGLARANFNRHKNACKINNHREVLDKLS